MRADKLALGLVGLRVLIGSSALLQQRAADGWRLVIPGKAADKPGKKLSGPAKR